MNNPEQSNEYERNISAVFVPFIIPILTIALLIEFVVVDYDLNDILLSSLILLPQLFLTGEYLLNDCRCKLVKRNEILCLVKGRNEYLIDDKHISTVFIFQSRLRKDRFHLFPWQSYYYLGLITTSGEKIALTMTIAYPLDEILSNVPNIDIETEYVEFPSLMHWLE